MIRPARLSDGKPDRTAPGQYVSYGGYGVRSDNLAALPGSATTASQVPGSPGAPLTAPVTAYPNIFRGWQWGAGTSGNRPGRVPPSSRWRPSAAALPRATCPGDLRLVRWRLMILPGAGDGAAVVPGGRPAGQSAPDAVGTSRGSTGRGGAGAGRPRSGRSRARWHRAARCG